MQTQHFMPVFRSDEMSEDCLYLNVWTPERDATEKLPVLVYFHGGGYVDGDGSEERYDGANLASRGIVTVTLNYRLGVFGFLAPPGAVLESPHSAAGNYGLLDQVAALRWVRDNIDRFGGDPAQVTIAGNSAGSLSVSAQMASPLSRGLFARAIGLSGAAFTPLKLWTREEGERAANVLAKHFDATSLAQLRALPASDLIATTDRAKPPGYLFWPTVDGHFLPETVETVFEQGRQATVPLLLGANSHEGHVSMVLRDAPPTPANWRTAIEGLFAGEADEALLYYPGGSEEEVMRSGTALATELFIGHSAWRWMDSHARSAVPVYYYLYVHPRPAERDATAAAQVREAQSADGAVHSAEIEYALGNLGNRPRYAWSEDDHTVSRIFSGYVEQFVKTGQPGGSSALPAWPTAIDERGRIRRQEIGLRTRTMFSNNRAHQKFLQKFLSTRIMSDIAAP
jgi:para-nitrobenzyl esterase